MKSVDVAVVGAGPAGLSASIETAKYGLNTVLLDENSKPGGQLFKQIHKFFGSAQQMAGTRGYQIGEKLLNLADKYSVEISLNSEVLGMDRNNTLAVIENNKYTEISAKRIILCCGATEKPLAFPGWTLPGIMGAGAVQTLVNIHKVLPGNKVVMVGSGNVGLIVTYHLLQAGVKVKAIIDASPTITGYKVHAAKIRRAGIPILNGYTVNKAMGDDHLTSVELIKVDKKFNKIPHKKIALTADTLCLAVGLSPSTELARMASCEITFNPSLGGYIPVTNENMQTSIKEIYCAGDMTGVEEASIAMEEGKLAGLSCVKDLRYCDCASIEESVQNIKSQLDVLRQSS